MAENDAKFEEFMELAFSKPADPYGLMCAYCSLPFLRPPESEKWVVRRRICECKEGQKTKRALIELAEKYEKAAAEGPDAS